MYSRRNHDNSEAYQMIWQFTIAPLMIAGAYMFIVLFTLSCIGTCL